MNTKIKHTTLQKFTTDTYTTHLASAVLKKRAQRRTHHIAILSGCSALCLLLTLSLTTQQRTQPTTLTPATLTQFQNTPLPQDDYLDLSYFDHQLIIAYNPTDYVETMNLNILQDSHTPY